MKKILLSVIFAAIGLMTTTSVMAASVAPSINETTAVNREVIRLISRQVYTVDIDENGRQIKSTGNLVDVISKITITDEYVTVEMADVLETLKIIEATDPTVDAEGTTSMVISCIDNEGEKAQFVLMTAADGEMNVTLHGDDTAVAFMQISVVD